MARHDVEVEIRTWAFRDRELPRVPPDGWATTTDRLRETVCLAIERSVDGIERIEPFAGPARERERFEATVAVGDRDGDDPGDDNADRDDFGDVADHVDLDGFADEYVRLIRTRSAGGSSGAESGDDSVAPSDGESAGTGADATGRSGDDFEERTEQFDLDEALDRL